jgi:hypothetical protein
MQQDAPESKIRGMESTAPIELKTVSITETNFLSITKGIKSLLDLDKE